MNSNEHLIVLDTEHGGFTSDASLLTAYFALYDSKGNKFNELDLYMKPDDEVYHVTANAMSVNQIDLVEHDKVAIPYTKAAKQLKQVLELWSGSGSNKLIPVGHNIAGDIDIIVDRLLNGRKTVWNHYCQYRKFDTGGLGLMAIRCGLLPDISASLGSLAGYLGIKHEHAHTAKDDALVTIKVFFELEKLFKRK